MSPWYLADCPAPSECPAYQQACCQEDITRRLVKAEAEVERLRAEATEEKAYADRATEREVDEKAAHLLTIQQLLAERSEVERLRAVIKRAYRDAPDDTDLQHYLGAEVEALEGKP